MKRPEVATILPREARDMLVKASRVGLESYNGAVDPQRLAAINDAIRTVRRRFPLYFKKEQ